jgi:hypothetical protein
MVSKMDERLEEKMDEKLEEMPEEMPEKMPDEQPIVSSRMPGWVPLALFLVVGLVVGLLTSGGLDRIRGLGGEPGLPPTITAIPSPVAAMQGATSAQACEAIMQSEGSNTYYFGEYLNAGTPKSGCIILLDAVWVER